MKNSCGKTTVIKKHDKFQRLNQKNYVLLIITFLQIHLALTFSMFCDDDCIRAILYSFVKTCVSPGKVCLVCL